MLKDEINLPENDDMIVRLGSKDDEVYLRTILSKLSQYSHIYITIEPVPPKLLKVREYYSYLKMLGVKEIVKREKISSPSLKDPKKIMQLIVIKWEVIPRLMKYREEIVKEELEEY